MAWYVYIIQSEVDGCYYKGFTEHPFVRLGQHNNGDSVYTSTKMPWKLVYVEETASKEIAWPVLPDEYPVPVYYQHWYSSG